MEQLYCSKIKTDLQVETRGASLDAEKQLNLQLKYHTDTYKWHTNKRPLQVDVAGASKNAPVNRKVEVRHNTHVYQTFLNGGTPPDQRTLVTQRGRRPDRRRTTDGGGRLP